MRSFEFATDAFASALRALPNAKLSLPPLYPRKKNYPPSPATPSHEISSNPTKGNNCPRLVLAMQVLAGLTPFYLEFARHPVTTELMPASDVEHAGLHFQVQAREGARRAAHDMVMDVMFGRYLSAKADPNRRNFSGEAGNLVDYYDENLRDYVGPAVLIGPVPGSERRYFLQSGAQKFHKCASQLRMHLSEDELNFPACIRELSDELVKAAPVMLSVDRREAVQDTRRLSVYLWRRDRRKSKLAKSIKGPTHRTTLSRS